MSDGRRAGRAATSPSRALWPGAVAFAVGITSCGAGDAQFDVRTASGFGPAEHRTVSALGVFKDGALSDDAWNELGRKLAPFLGPASCEPAWGSRLRALDSPLASAIDAYARTNGPSDALLGALAPMADGDVVLLITVFGRLPVDTADAGNGVPAVALSAPRGRGRGRSRTTPSASAPPRDEEALVLSASLYSVVEHRSVARVEMKYAGHSVDEATRQFVAKLTASFPRSSCVGWKWEARPRVDVVRNLGEE